MCSCVIKPGRAACGGGTPRPSKQGLKPLYDARFFFWVTVSVPKIPFSLDRVFEGGEIRMSFGRLDCHLRKRHGQKGDKLVRIWKTEVIVA